MQVPPRLKKFSSMVRQTVLPGQGEIGRTERFVASAVRFFVQMGRQFAHDRCLRQAASLSYQTLLVFVPLGALILALTQWVQRLGDRPAVTQLLERLVMPEAARDLAERMNEMVVQVDFEAIGWVGGIVLTFLAGTLILQIEDVLNDVWNVPRGRALWQRAASMLGIVLFALPAFAAALYLSIDRLRPPYDWLAPFGLLALSLALIYKLLPHIRVRWRSAIAGALVAAVLLALGHMGYGAYVERFRWTYESVYGAIAFLPLTLLFVYANWVIFLLGAEVSYTSQNLHVLWAKARRRHERSVLRDDIVGSVSWPNAVRAAREVAVAQTTGRGPVAPEFLALELGVHVDSINLIVTRLVLAGVLHRDPEGLLSLGRKPSSIALLEVYDAVVDRRPLDPDVEALAALHRNALRDLTLCEADVGDETG